MPVLIGGAKLRNKKKPFGLQVEFNNEKLIGKGGEGRSYKVGIELKTKKSKRTLTRVLKFFKKGSTSYFPNWRNPFRQFKVARELIELNQKNKLGLRTFKSIRLAEIKTRGKRFVLVVPFIEGLEKVSELTKTEGDKFIEDADCQIEIMKKHGFTAGYDAFVPKRDETGKIIAFLIEFGTVARFR